MTQHRRNRIEAFLAAHTTLSLATVDKEGHPHAASLFYAQDEALSIVFVSEPAVLHSRNVAAQPRVSATIAEDHQSWREIQGVQLEGVCELLSGEASQAARKVYLARFPFITENPQLSTRIADSGLYRIRPFWIRLGDNTRGFGFKEELELPPHPG